MKIAVFYEKPDDFIPTVYVTGACVLFNERFLFLQYAENKKEAGRWGVPAGKREDGETPEDAVCREIFEETGIVVDPKAVTSMGQMYIRKPDVEYIYHGFRVYLEMIRDVTLSEEHVDYCWALFEELQTFDLMDGAKEVLEQYQKSIIL